MRWHGGKWRLAPWIIGHFPPHRVYVEPFGGAGSVLLRKPRAAAEVYNDLDDEVVSLFRVLRDPEASARLVELLRLTPFARTEFYECYQPTDDPIESARRLCIRSRMGFGSNAHATTGTNRAQTGFRANSNRSGTTPAQDWGNYPDTLAAVIDRLAGVVVEHRPAVQVMAAHDGPETLHYVDPPYLLSLRNPGHPYDRKHMYRHEMSDADHEELLGFLRGLTGMVVLSGYPSELYEHALADWHRVETEALADGARKRTEALWINPLAATRLDDGRLRLSAGSD
ncbi:MAG: DNA adenine methylase [Bauldia sp.]|nr:DNA adenine methylase [Bauldia sp.]